MMIFIMASGLTLVFGLMDVLNFGHGAFISVGAFVAASVLLRWRPGSRRIRWGSTLPPWRVVLAAVIVSGAWAPSSNA